MCIISSSFLENLQQLIETVGKTAWKIIGTILGVVLVLSFVLATREMVTREMVWKSVTGQKVERERQICDRCGRQMALDGWYWSTAEGVQESLLVVLEGVEEGGTFLDRCWER